MKILSIIFITLPVFGQTPPALHSVTNVVTTAPIQPIIQHTNAVVIAWDSCTNCPTNAVDILQQSTNNMTWFDMDELMPSWDVSELTFYATNTKTSYRVKRTLQ